MRCNAHYLCHRTIFYNQKTWFFISFFHLWNLTFFQAVKSRLLQRKLGFPTHFLPQSLKELCPPISLKPSNRSLKATAVGEQLPHQPPTKYIMGASYSKTRGKKKPRHRPDDDDSSPHVLISNNSIPRTVPFATDGIYNHALKKHGSTAGIIL